MKRKIIIFLVLIFQGSVLFSSPRINFRDLLEKAERDVQVYRDTRNAATQQGLPVNILTSDRVMIDAKGIEDGRIVYAVITDFAYVFNGGYTAFYEEVAGRYDISSSKITYGNGTIVDNTGGMYDPVFTRSTPDRFLMIPEWTADKVYLFDAQTGNLVDADFIPTTNPQLQSPKVALMHFSGRFILVADQLSDVVQKFDTNGSYIGFYAPSTGVNNAILDNIRGAAYRLNKNMLVTVGSGSSSNTIQQFDSGGVSIGSFITSGLNSPFDILLRSGDVLVTNSSGTNKITKYDPSGVFISNFYTGVEGNFPQQLIQIPGGRLMYAAFSGTSSGLTILDENGAYIRSLTAVSGTRGAYLLGNGHYLTTNAAGVHEVDSATGTLIRTISTAANFQYITPYNPGVLLGNGNNGINTPDGFTLEQNYPNPFNPETSIRFTLPENSFVSLKVYDINGKLVKTLVNGSKSAGSHEVSFNASELSSGVYFYTLKAGGFTESKKMLLTK
jgi:hypothetical protein